VVWCGSSKCRVIRTMISCVSFSSTIRTLFLLSSFLNVQIVLILLDLGRSLSLFFVAGWGQTCGPYDETPPSAQPWLRTYPQSPNFLEGLDQPQEDSIYYVHNPYAEASSSAVHDDHQPKEEHEPQPSHVEEPRPEVRRRNPTKNRRRPQCGTGHHYGD